MFQSLGDWCESLVLSALLFTTLYPDLILHQNSIIWCSDGHSSLCEESNLIDYSSIQLLIY